MITSVLKDTAHIRRRRRRIIRYSVYSSISLWYLYTENFLFFIRCHVRFAGGQKPLREETRHVLSLRHLMAKNEKKKEKETFRFFLIYCFRQRHLAVVCWNSLAGYLMWNIKFTGLNLGRITSSNVDPSSSITMKNTTVNC